jgi:sigma-E factor negative regulatory protein RseA
MDMKEEVSAMMDGEIAGRECDRCVARMKVDPFLRAESWDLYHLIGDALRGHIAPAVIDQVREKLAAEPTVLAPSASPMRSPRRAGWYALSAAASVAAVALVGWMALPLFDLQPARLDATAARVVEAPPTAAAPAATPVTVPAAHGVSDYLLAHQRFSPSSTIGGNAPYVRTVTEEAR